MSDLHPSLQAGIDEFAQWWHRQQTAADMSQKVRRPLYQYTDAAGLKGIIENQEVWFSSLFHLNDPSELRHGVDCAVEELRELRAVALQRGDNIIQTVCDQVERLVTHDPRSELGFFVASFSRASDDLGQWRGYADDGRGFAVGLAPRLFQINETVDSTTPESNVFVAPVNYGDKATRIKQRQAIETAFDIILRTIHNPVCRRIILQDNNQGDRFIGEMCVQLLVPLMWNSVTTKHSAYANEKEVRLIILGHLPLFSKIEIRTRKGELVPFIRSPMATQNKGNITRVVIGPAAGPTAEDGVNNLLWAWGIDPTNRVFRSKIPYRGR